MTSTVVWWVLICGWLASEIWVGVATRTKQSSGKVQDRGSMALMWIVVVVAMTLCNTVAETGPRNLFGGAHWLKTAGIVGMALGLSVRWTAIATLGKAFSANVAILDSQKIMKRGLYRFVRHPSYLGLLLVFVAVGLHSRNRLALVVAVVPTTAAMLYRIQVEELALNVAFGEEYLAYSRETKRLVPGIY